MDLAGVGQVANWFDPYIKKAAAVDFIVVHGCRFTCLALPALLQA